MEVILIERELAVSLAYASNMQRDYVVVRQGMGVLPSDLFLPCL